MASFLRIILAALAIAAGTLPASGYADTLASHRTYILDMLPDENPGICDNTQPRKCEKSLVLHYNAYDPNEDVYCFPPVIVTGSLRLPDGAPIRCAGSIFKADEFGNVDIKLAIDVNGFAEAREYEVHVRTSELLLCDYYDGDMPKSEFFHWFRKAFSATSDGRIFISASIPASKSIFESLNGDTGIIEILKSVGWMIGVSFIAVVVLMTVTGRLWSGALKDIAKLRRHLERMTGANIASRADTLQLQALSTKLRALEPKLTTLRTAMAEIKEVDIGFTVLQDGLARRARNYPGRAQSWISGRGAMTPAER